MRMLLVYVLNLKNQADSMAKLMAAVLLILMFGLAVTSMGQKAPTFDEQGFIVRGLAYWRGYKQIRVGHPLGLNLLNSGFLANDDGVSLPTDDPSWGETSFHRPAELFLWEIGNDVRHIMFLSRLPTIYLGLLLAALACCWVWRITGQKWLAIWALIFVAFDPNILAHTRLSTTDLGLAAFSLLAGYTLWRFLKRPSIRNLVWSGIAMGLLQNTKFTAALFIPLFAVVVTIWLIQVWISNWRSKSGSGSWLASVPWRLLLLLIFVYPIVALITLWVANGFDIGTLPADLALVPGLAGKTIPLANYFEQLLDIGGRMQVETPSFLLGQYSDSGWWYYFPIAFLLKTPLPTLILLLWGGIAFVYSLLKKHKGSGNALSIIDASALLVPALGYFAIALTTDINLGYRHILPVLSYLIVFAISAISPPKTRANEKKLTLPISFLAVWLFVSALMIYPDFLAYFNILAGGPEKGWQALVDSNLDWGQDIDDLAQWMNENDVDQVWLSYFGEGRPEYYGVSYQGLDSFPPRLMDPQTRPFFPFDPSPGIYAISATNLQGVHFANHDQFAWFREEAPLAKLGYSIFIYEVLAHGNPVDLLLSGVQLDEIDVEDFQKLGGNDIRPRWFDMSQALIIPVNSPAWLVTGKDIEINSHIKSFLKSVEIMESQSPDYQLVRYEPPALPDTNLAEFRLGEASFNLNVADIFVEDDKLSAVTTWQKFGEPRPLKIFMHILDNEGHILAQWDGLGGSWQGLRDGDHLIQLHEISLPKNFDPLDFKVIAGVYDPETGERWMTDQNTDNIELK